MSSKAGRAPADDDRIDEANAQTVRRIVDAKPYFVDVRPAGEVIPGLEDGDFLHAGPPLAGWQAVTGALRAAVCGALVHAGLAHDVTEAAALADAGKVRMKSANDADACGTYAGVIGRKTPVVVVENRAAGTRAYAALNEGRGKALRYGAYDADTLARLAWLEGEFADILAAAIRLAGGIDVYEIVVQALHMGDDGHSRQKAASALLLNTIAPFIVETGVGSAAATRALRFMARNDIFFLPLTMAASKSTMLAAHGVHGSAIVTCMAMNGVEFGIKASGTGGRWFTAPLPTVQGAYFDGYGPDDANPAIGDSEIAETNGLGAFAMSAAPALARYCGGTPQTATQLAVEMYRISVVEHPRFNIPQLDYRGTPTGIDLRKVVASGVTPIFNTGIAHKQPGIGQIGAGYARTPAAVFAAALRALTASGDADSLRRG